MKSKARQPTQFEVCTDNTGYAASLEIGKLYAVIPDAQAAKHGYVRVIDESGEDYAYSAQRFFALEVPAALERALRGRSHASAPPKRVLGPTLASARRVRQPSSR